MSRILMAWELGGNFGHLSRLLPIARRLGERGHGVVLAVRDTRAAAELLGPAGVTFVQAPVLSAKARNTHPPASYAEILLGEGYGDPAALGGRVSAWRSLLKLTQSDVVLADHSPTALLAARISGVPHLAIGNEFALPPDVWPLPSIRPWEDIPESRLAAASTAVDDAIARVARRFGYRQPIALRNLFGPQDLLDTLVELDHYPRRVPMNAIGPIFSINGARRIDWLEARSRKIVAYLRPDIPGFGAMLAALRETDAEALCIAPGLHPAQAHRLIGRRLRISVVPLDLSHLLQDADLAITYGSGATCAQVLLAGKPLLVMPRFIEQYLRALRVESLGVGLQLARDRSPAACVHAISTILDDTRYATCAKAIAERYAGYVPKVAVERAVAAIENCALLSGEGRPKTLNG